MRSPWYIRYGCKRTEGRVRCAGVGVGVGIQDSVTRNGGPASLRPVEVGAVAAARGVHVVRVADGELVVVVDAEEEGVLGREWEAQRPDADHRRGHCLRGSESATRSGAARSERRAQEETRGGA